MYLSDGAQEALVQDQEEKGRDVEEVRQPSQLTLDHLPNAERWLQ